jgi:hypothetical protein
MWIGLFGRVAVGFISIAALTNGAIGFVRNATLQAMSHPFIFALTYMETCYTSSQGQVPLAVL